MAEANAVPEIKPFLWAYEIDETGHSKELKEPIIPEKGYLWLHLAYDNLGAETLLEQLHLDEQTIEQMCALETRPKAVVQDKGQFLILRAVNLNKDLQSTPEFMISLRFWVGNNVVITARNSTRKLYSLLDLKEVVVQQQAPTSSTDFALRMIELLTDKIRNEVDRIEEDLAGLESEVTIHKLGDTKNSLSVLQREAASIKRYLSPQKEALENLYRLQKSLDNDQLYWLRDSIERTTRYLEDLELVRERSLVLQEDVRGQIAEEQNQRMYVLSIVTAIFLPLSFLTGVFGMNVAGLPGIENPGSFMLLCSCMIIISIILLGLMKKYRWL